MRRTRFRSLRLLGIAGLTACTVAACTSALSQRAPSDSEALSSVEYQTPPFDEGDLSEDSNRDSPEKSAGETAEGEEIAGALPQPDPGAVDARNKNRFDGTMVPAEPTQPSAPMTASPAPVEEKSVVVTKKTVIDFTDVAIGGAMVTPQGSAAGPGRRRGSGQGLMATAPPPRVGGVTSVDRGPQKPEVKTEQNELPQSGDTFAKEAPNRFTETAEDRLSTFAIDVDTASYSLARRYLLSGGLPQPQAVRVEEFVNYFKYKYPAPESGAFSVHLDGAPSPFGRGRHLLKVGVQGKQIAKSQRKPANLVFLVDTSGSMSGADRLPLAKEALGILVRNLNENDTVSLVTYAGSTREVLPPTPATEQTKILAAINALGAGGGTAMGSGFQRAYENALRGAGGGVNSRVIVLTDGDTNIGPNLSADAMLESVRKYVSEGVTLSTVGFGMGNYRDDLMERLANKGNGNCFYIDGVKEAKRVFETQIAGTLEVIAKDVKIQVDFNPETVKTYRLIGYENRNIADRDFRNDKVDAGEIGAGHSVTAMYEVELTGAGGDLATVRIRAKEPTGAVAREQAFRFGRDRLFASMDRAPADLRFATAVVGTADILRHNPAAEGWSLAAAQALAEGAVEGMGDRKEFVHLVAQARRLTGDKSLSAGR